MSNLEKETIGDVARRVIWTSFATKSFVVPI
jgi:hypothetical protein